MGRNTYAPGARRGANARVCRRALLRAFLHSRRAPTHTPAFFALVAQPLRPLREADCRPGARRIANWYELRPQAPIHRIPFAKTVQRNWREIPFPDRAAV